MASQDNDSEKKSDTVGNSNNEAPKQLSKKALKKQAFKQRQALKKASKQNRQKMTKEERRAKYTQKARDKRSRQIDRKRNQGLVCFRCRKKGHTVSECTSLEEGVGTNAEDVTSYATIGREKICYKCGSIDHPLKSCPKLTFAEKNSGGKNRMDYFKIELPFATCFICNRKGHLSSQCEQNKNGIYVKGGSCKECGGKDHLFLNCPKRRNARDKGEEGGGNGEEGGNIEQFLEQGDYGGECLVISKESNLEKKTKKISRKVVKF